MASITKHGAGWRVRVTRKGHGQINKTFPNRKDAEAFAAITESELARGVFKRNAADHTTVRELVQRYLDEVTPTKRGAVKEAQKIQTILAAPAARRLLGKSVSTLSPSDVTTWRNARLKTVSPSTVGREWSLLSHVAEVARREFGYEAFANPFKTVRKPVVQDRRDRRITTEELDGIVAATESAEMGAVLRLAVETAARRSELLSLQWRDVDLQNQTAKLHGSQTKNGTARVLPLSQAACTVLRTLPRRLDGRVFGLRPDSLSQAFRRAVERARRRYEDECASKGVVSDDAFLIGVRLHDARHEAVSRLAELGLTTVELQSVSGHKTLGLLSRYIHLSPEKLARKLG